MRVWLILLATIALDGPARALDLQLPGTATLSAETLNDPDSYELPTGPFANGQLETRRVEGRVLQQAWWIEQSDTTTLQLIRPLRDALDKAGYELLYSCDGQQCGGFDFRFTTRVMPAPDMYVDLFDFRYLAAVKGDEQTPGGAEYLSVIVSKSALIGYVQITHVATGDGDGDSDAVTVARDGTQVATEPTQTPTLIGRLNTQGHVVLRDLDFETGSSSLGRGPHGSLRALAGFLNADTTRRIVLVGHTDAVGSLADNIALSKKRAASVLERLVSEYDVSRSQLAAEGTGFLAPVGPNLTAEGRETNRRVEAVLLNTN